ncbi:XRE family transcriptional regulator [Methylobacterium sp. Leaf123]|uniref:helix-turn-helix domain-containing protein n=1 Tax=Methylobacterium sp. Leaf123 TaxID=1736264 RepID=UPI0006F40CDB|nr:helix-turn-helix transcriptional regulator [Methylobacterium sp. Leaf123]KQQ13230.1 XRE family transcriptional regulator [Methylobacterium sp. Leaf123]
MPETFGSFILRTRKEKCISQKELASKILREEDGKPISPQYLNDIERDRRNPTSDHLIEQFASALNVQAEYLFYLAGTLPHDVRAAGAKPEEVVQFFNAFRKSTR